MCVIIESRRPLIESELTTRTHICAVLNLNRLVCCLTFLQNLCAFLWTFAHLSTANVCPENALGECNKFLSVVQPKLNLAAHNIFDIFLPTFKVMPESSTRECSLGKKQKKKK